MGDFAKNKDVPDKNVRDTISRQAAIDSLWKALYEYEDKTEKQFMESEELDVGDWIQHRIFVQNMSDIDRQTILNLPSVEQQQWIPVAEGLPEDLEEVNVTWVNHAPEQYYDFIKDKHFTGSAVYYKGSWYWSSPTCVDILMEYGRNEMDKMDDDIEVVAYMPLPEPWKGASDG